MIVMEVLMQVPQGTMVGIVFRAAVEAFLVSAAVGLAQVLVELPVLRVIVVVVVGQRRHRGHGEQQHCRRYQSLIHGHR
jgi:hypothetical protein